MPHDDDEHLLARLEERVGAIQRDLHQLVTRAEFQPVKAITYGLVAITLSGVLAAIIALVVRGAN